MPQALGLGDWQVEPLLGRASKGDRVVHLSAKVMGLLVFFVERPGQVVSKNELLNGVWHSEFVRSLASLRNCDRRSATTSSVPC
jgi:DNA-binding winged helix-turn-helix (wHTH) protein